MIFWKNTLSAVSVFCLWIGVPYEAIANGSSFVLAVMRVGLELGMCRMFGDVGCVVFGVVIVRSRQECHRRIGHFVPARRQCVCLIRDASRAEFVFSLVTLWTRIPWISVIGRMLML